ncbi:MAG: DUF4298 domain-containing protein [Clostridia bacterium]|nr:DUF4298 domain-containing protein [Clostridia bacterium]
MTAETEQRARIRAMEERLDRMAEAAAGLERALDAFEAALPGYGELLAYYGSDLWFGDVADDDAGRIPKDLKRGVLSEDGVYDLLTETDGLAERMRALANAAESAKRPG